MAFLTSDAGFQNGTIQQQQQPPQQQPPSSARPRGVAAQSDDEYIRANGTGGQHRQHQQPQQQQQWSAHFAAPFGLDSKTDSGPQTSIPTGYKHYRKAPPPPPPSHKPRSATTAAASSVPAAGNSPPPATRNRSKSTVNSGYVPRGDMSGVVGADSEAESEVRKQEVMAVLSAFRSMGSPEVRATAFQIGNVLHSPKKPDLSAKPLKSALKKKPTSDRSRNDDDSSDMTATATTVTTSPLPGNEPIAKPEAVKRGSVWKQCLTQWLACGITIRLLPEPQVQLSIQTAQPDATVTYITLQAKDILSVQSTQGTDDFKGGFFLLETVVEKHTLAVPGETDAAAQDWVEAFNNFLNNEVLDSPLPSHPVKSPSTVSIQESGYGSSSQDTLEQCSPDPIVSAAIVSGCSSSSNSSGGGGGLAALRATTGGVSKVADQSPTSPSAIATASMLGLRSQLGAHLMARQLGRSSPDTGRCNAATASSPPAPVAAAPSSSSNFVTTTAPAAAAPASRYSPSGKQHSLYDGEEEDDFDELDGDTMRSSTSSNSSMSRSLANRSSMRLAMHSQVAIPAPVTEPTYRTYGPPSQHERQLPGRPGSDDVFEQARMVLSPTSPNSPNNPPSRRSSLTLALRDDVDVDDMITSAGRTVDNDVAVASSLQSPDGLPLARSSEYEYQESPKAPTKIGSRSREGKNPKKPWLTVRLTKKEKEEQQRKIKKRRARSVDNLDGDDDDDDGNGATRGPLPPSAPSSHLPPMATNSRIAETITFAIGDEVPRSPPPQSSPATSGNVTGPLDHRVHRPPGPARPHSSQACYLTGLTPAASDGYSPGGGGEQRLLRTSNNSPAFSRSASTPHDRGTPPIARKPSLPTTSLLRMPAPAGAMSSGNIAQSASGSSSNASMSAAATPPLPPPPSSYEPSPPCGSASSPPAKSLPFPPPPPPSHDNVARAAATRPPPPPAVLPKPSAVSVAQQRVNSTEEVSGLVWRQEQGSVLWKKLWMQLCNDDTLKLYAPEKKMSDQAPLDVIHLADILMVNRMLDMDGAVQEERFELVAHTQVAHLFSTHSQTECQRWIATLSEAVYLAHKMRRREQKRLRRRVSMTTGADAASTPSPGTPPPGGAAIGGGGTPPLPTVVKVAKAKVPPFLPHASSPHVIPRAQTSSPVATVTSSSSFSATCRTNFRRASAPGAGVAPRPMSGLRSADDRLTSGRNAMTSSTTARQQMTTRQLSQTQPSCNQASFETVV